MAGERQIEMTWRCSSCGHRNLGRHMVCQGCGSPKDDSEEYEMPGSTATAATVTDPALLRMAHAGANWRCRYCGSDQRTLSGACGQCGSSQSEGHSTAARAPSPALDGPQPSVLTRVGRRRLAAVALSAGALLVVVLAICGVARSDVGRVHARVGSSTTAMKLPFHEEAGTVTGVRWKQVITVERWTKLPGEGFAESKPAEAVDVRSVDSRFHHTERVLDGYDTESYTETVSDGYRTESYSARESCGQDCTSRPQSCSEKCTSNKNGFASCRTVCTGGGQTCSTKYCTVTKTRQVPQTKTVHRTRQVPRYRNEARNATWYAWKIWGWKAVRSLEKTGETPDTRWPEEGEVKLGKGLAAGEKEREARSASYTARVMCGSTPREIQLTAPEQLRDFPVGGSRRVRIWNDGRVVAL